MTPRRVVVSPEAESDLSVIYQWIADAGSPQNALGFIDKIERFCFGLAVAPQRGQGLLAYGDRHVRAVGLRRQATVLFRVETNVVTILRAYRAGLDWTAGLQQDD